MALYWAAMPIATAHQPSVNDTSGACRPVAARWKPWCWKKVDPL
jgi:hypothetical protein